MEKLIRMKSILAVAAASVFTLTLSAQETTVYNSIPNPLPGNVQSEGLEADGLAELGDALSLTGPVGALHQVTVVLSSWACQNGTWYASNCVTKSGATFNQSVTLNIYSVGNADTLMPGVPLASITDTFSIPYRPSSIPGQCADSTAWYNSKDQQCYHGIAAPITFNLTNQHIVLPQKVIVTVSYNTTHYGPNPITESAACFKTSAGCPYDSLNISTDTNGVVLAGSPFLSNGIVVRNASGFGLFPVDSNSHPEIQITGNQNGVPGKQKSVLPR
jgi:hypothetical protein